MFARWASRWSQYQASSVVREALAPLAVLGVFVLLLVLAGV